MILAHNLDWFTSADTFSSRQVFVSVLFTVRVGDGHLIFGPGTKLYVTGGVDEQVVKPVVSVYPAASSQSSLLCLASDMFPPLVKFSWERQKENGAVEKVTADQGEQIRLSGCPAAILTIGQRESLMYNYSCSVEHESGTVEAQTGQENPTLQPTTRPESLQQATFPPTIPPSLPPSLPPSHPPFPPLDSSFQTECRVKLLVLLYTLLIVKSLVYCCGLSLMMIFRNKGPSIN